MKFTTKQMRSAAANLNAPRAAEMLFEASRLIDTIGTIAVEAYEKQDVAESDTALEKILVVMNRDL